MLLNFLSIKYYLLLDLLILNFLHRSLKILLHHPKKTLSVEEFDLLKHFQK